MDKSFHELMIKQVERLTPESVAIELEVPETLLDTFKYQAGQYLTFRIFVDGEEIRRSYSICSAPYERKWVVGVKHVPGGKFSSLANQQLKPGDRLEVMPPMGRFTVPENTGDKRFVAFVAGSGITPVLAIIKQTLYEFPDSTFTLFFGNKQSSSIMFRRELNQLKNLYMQRLQVHHVLSREVLDAELFCGRIDASRCERFANLLFRPLQVDHYFICGPEQMILTVRDVLINTGVSREKIHVELFTTPGEKKAQSAKTAKKEYGDATAAVTLKLDGRTMQFPLAFDGNSILDAALELGADLPYACKGGVCSTCMARLVDGEVEMDVNYALEPDEVERGFILTCQSHPRTASIAVDYDDV